MSIQGMMVDADPAKTESKQLVPTREEKPYEDERLHALVQTDATSTELLTFFDQQTKRLMIQLVFGFAALLSIGGTAILIAGSSSIGGLGLIGFGSATVGSLFTYITGGQVKLEDFADAARALPRGKIGETPTEKGGKEND